MVEIGGEPILWHIMNIYSYHGIISIPVPERYFPHFLEFSILWVRSVRGIIIISIIVVILHISEKEKASINYRII